MIQPIDINVDDEGMEKSYRVRDMVIDPTRFLPSEENVAKLHGNEQRVCLI
jgi:hypothetical protein